MTRCGLPARVELCDRGACSSAEPPSRAGGDDLSCPPSRKRKKDQPHNLQEQLPGGLRPDAMETQTVRTQERPSGGDGPPPATNLAGTSALLRQLVPFASSSGFIWGIPARYALVEVKEDGGR